MQAYDDGGQVDQDQDQDTGDAQQPSTDPFSAVEDALSFGRQQYGLPETLVAGNIPARPAGPGGDKPNDNPFPTVPINPFGRRPGGGQPFDTGMNDQGPDANNETQVAGNIPARPAGPGGDRPNDNPFPTVPINPFGQRPGGGKPFDVGMNDQDQDDSTALMADGGSVDDTTGVLPTGNNDPTENDEGPQGADAQQTPLDPQKTQAYLMGHGAMAPDMAAALERSVDPTGAMDPNARVLQAMQAAGSPQRRFSLLQHYRQKFNAYNAFARAAAQGTQNKPADLMASARAATQAYQNLPDGKSLQFMPVRGGMKVAVRDAVARGNSPAKGASAEKGFDEGGPVTQFNTDDTFNPANNAPQGPTDANGNDASSSGVIPTADKDPNTFHTDFNARPAGTAPDQTIKQFVLSIPQWLGWLGNHGQADSVLDQGAEHTLQQAQSQQAQGPQQSPVTQVPVSPSGAQQPDAFMTGGQNLLSNSQPQPAPVQGQPQQSQQAQQQGTTAAASGKENNMSLQDVLHEIDQSYPYIGQSQARGLARAAAIQEWNKNRTALEGRELYAKALVAREGIRGQYGLDRARVGAEGRMNLAQFVQDQINNRSVAGLAARMKIAQQTNDTRALTSQMGVLRTAIGSQLGNGVGADDVNAATDQILQHYGINTGQGGQQPQQRSPAGSPAGSPPAPPRQAQSYPVAPTTPNGRIAGQVYQTPKGPLTWTGTGWIQPGR